MLYCTYNEHLSLHKSSCTAELMVDLLPSQMMFWFLDEVLPLPTEFMACIVTANVSPQAPELYR